MKMQKTRHSYVLGWQEWTLLGIVGASVLAVLIVVIMNLCYRTPAEQAKSELKRLAENYYTTVLYDNLLANKDSDPAERLSRFTETGVPITYLRHLLNSGEAGKMAKSQVIFAQAGCDTDVTGVRFFPKEPYGRKDFTIEYNWRCSEIPTE